VGSRRGRRRAPRSPATVSRSRSFTRLGMHYSDAANFVVIRIGASVSCNLRSLQKHNNPKSDTRLIHWDEETHNIDKSSVLVATFISLYSTNTVAEQVNAHPDISKFLNFSIRKRNGIHCTGTNASSWKFIPAHMVTPTHIQLIIKVKFPECSGINHSEDCNTSILVRRTCNQCQRARQ
jgi:hypothetical protein